MILGDVIMILHRLLCLDFLSNQASVCYSLLRDHEFLHCRFPNTMHEQEILYFRQRISIRKCAEMISELDHVVMGCPLSVTIIVILRSNKVPAARRTADRGRER